MSTEPFGERIQYDTEKGFYIERRYTNFPNKEPDKLPLSVWNLEKSVQVSVILVRVVENIDINQGTQKTLFYEVPISYEVSGKDSEAWFLKVEKIKNAEDRFNRITAKVFLRNVETQECQECPLPNILFEPSTRPYLTITKGKAKRLRKGELDPILKSGSCLGIFNLEMTNKIIA